MEELGSIKDKNGSVLVEKTEVLNEWQEYTELKVNISEVNESIVKSVAKILLSPSWFWK